MKHIKRGNPPPEGSMRLTINMRKPLHARLVRAAAKSGSTITETIIAALAARGIK